MENKYAFFEKALKKRLEQKQYRQLRCVVPLDENYFLYQGKPMVNFSSNDYLGLSQHPYVKKNTIKYVLKWGVGSTASRLVTGHLECHYEIEQKLAKLLGTEEALLFSSGFQANSTILAAIANKDSHVFLDRLCHNSLIQGAISSRAKVMRYEHNNMKQLEVLLEKHKESPSATRMIVSESIFSMEGDTCHLNRLIELAKHYQAHLYIDDAHAFGVIGKHGMGLTAQRKGIDITIGTFGKACGSFGAYVACSKLMKEYLVNFFPGFIYTTALPPAILGAISAALDLIPDMEEERKKIASNSEWLREELRKNFWSIGPSDSHIIPLMVGDEEQTLKLSDSLRESGFLTVPIRPPAVPKGKSRIRLAIHALHTPDQINTLAEKLKSWKANYTPVTV